MEPLENMLSDEDNDLWQMICLDFPVGSRETCSPPPDDGDYDYLCLVVNREEFVKEAAKYGFTDETVQTPEKYLGTSRRFTSLRRGELNLIASDDEAFIQEFRAATSIAKKFNLLKRDDRVALFQAVLYGMIDKGE